MKLGTLGSRLTFAGQATESLVARGDHDREVAYFATMDDVVAAIHAGQVEGGVLTSETSHTQITDTVARMLAGDRLFIAEEIVVPYHCALLGKPGTRLEDITHVGGHGSIRQCREFLETKLSHATAEMHRKNSVVAAREVLDGDGSTAVIATEAVAAELGLEIIERDVDHGSVGGWWVLTAAMTAPVPHADHIAVVAEGQHRLDSVLHDLAAHGLAVRTVTNQSSGQIFEYRYLVTARTADGTPIAEAQYAPFGSELRGVFATASVR